MKIGILVQLKDNVYECIAQAARQGFNNGQLSVWDMSLYNDDMMRRRWLSKHP